MKKGWIICLVLLLTLTTSMYASAKEADNTSISELLAGLAEEKGGIAYTLPEQKAIHLQEDKFSYPITWKPLQNISSYYMGLVAVINSNGTEWVFVTDGWMGADFVKNGKGQSYFCQNVVFNSIVLDGNASQIDIAEKINKLSNVTEHNVIGCYLVILIVPESGEPIHQAIPIPLAAFAAL